MLKIDGKVSSLRMVEISVCICYYDDLLYPPSSPSDDEHFNNDYSNKLVSLISLVMSAFEWSPTSYGEPN